MESQKTIYFIVGIIIHFLLFPLIGILLDRVLFESTNFLSWIFFFIGVITFKNSFKKLTSAEVGGALLFGEFIHNLDEGVNYVFLGFLKDSIVKFPNKVITFTDLKTQEVTYIDHTHESKKELDPLDLFAYPYQIDISLSVRIVKPEYFFKSTGLYKLDIDFEPSKKLSWEKNIISNILSTFETIGSFLGYPEMKIKSDWNEEKISNAIAEHGSDYPGHKVSETLPETLRSFGMEITDINTTSSLTESIRAKVEDVWNKNQEMRAKAVEAKANIEISRLEAEASAEKEKIRMTYQREILRDTIADMLHGNDHSLTKATATENAMIMMDSFNNEQIYRLSGTDGESLKAFEAAMLAWLSKNSSSTNSKKRKPAPKGKN